MASLVSREDYERRELASAAALELDKIRLGQLGQIRGSVEKLVAWFEENFRSVSLIEPTQTECLWKVLTKTGYLSENVQQIADLIEAVGQIQIILRGIIAEPVSARKSIPTIEKMRDFCLALCRA
ncbi:MAG: hypothetical protein ABSE91_01095 [Patescibacteria group bacterium]|jgi:hypothetical protein